jgi:hypothetical protein
MAHTLDTNMNEAFNQICTWFAPKNKVFDGRGSLHNRIAFAVGILQTALQGIRNPLHGECGQLSAAKRKESQQEAGKVKIKEAKLKKDKRKYDKLADDVKIAKQELLQ